MPDDDCGPPALLCRKPGKILGHRAKPKAHALPDPCKALSGQIWRHHVIVLGEKRKETAPALRRAARTMQQKNGGPFPGFLHVPAMRTRVDETRVGGVRPGRLLARPVHAYSPSAVVTAADKRCASARGSAI